jgi:alpha-methylacyl-CoA racemase
MNLAKTNSQKIIKLVHLQRKILPERIGHHPKPPLCPYQRGYRVILKKLCYFRAMDMAPLKIGWLKGIKVLLLGHYVPAPIAAYLLHNLGAEVIKVEDDRGDPLRKIGSFGPATADEMSPMFWTLNAGFQSLGLRYRRPAGADLLRRIIEKVDVVLDGNRAGALERYLGAPISKISPHTIFVPITAYGIAGPMSHLAGHDNNILALAGNLSYTQTGPTGRPSIFSAPVADLFAGQLAAMGALAALLGRKINPREVQGPQTIDASMLHAGFFLNLLELAARNDHAAHIPLPGKEWMNGGRPDYTTYRCSDDRFIFFGLIEPWAAKRFFVELGREDLAAYLSDPQSRTQADWVQIGKGHDACITPVNDLEQAVQDPQIQALGRMQTITALGIGSVDVPSFPLGFGALSQPIAPDQVAPSVGEHNDEILLKLLEIGPSEIQSLYEQEILIRPAKKS